MIQDKLPIDVVGYSFKVVDTNLDKSSYYPQDQMKLSVRLDANKDLVGCQVKFWLKSANTSLILQDATKDITTGTNLMNFNLPMKLTANGMAQIVFCIYHGDLQVSAGQEAFDVTLPDTTPPESMIVVNSPQVSVNGNSYYVSPSSFTITSNDLISGVDYLEYAVDNSTCTKVSYEKPLDFISNLADGPHFVKYHAVDKLGNIEPFKTMNFTIDGNPPDAKIQVLGTSFGAYIGKDAKIQLSATDNGSGVDKITYRVDAGTNTVYTDQFGLDQEGSHVIYYSASDKLGNVSSEKNYQVQVDTTAPVTSWLITDTSYQVTEGTNTYVNSHSTFTVTAQDILSNNVSSGVKEMKYQIGDSAWQVVTSSTQAVSLSDISDGAHIIKYHSSDNVNNTEDDKTYTAIFDGTAPQVLTTFPANNARMKAKQAAPVKIAFSEPVKCADWTKAITIKADKNNANRDFTIKYDSSTLTLTIDGKLKNNAAYEITMNGNITDRVKNQLADYTLKFQTMIDAKAGGTITDEATGLTLIIPPNALPCDGYFEIAQIDQVNPPRLPKPLQWLFDGRKAYQIILRDEQGNIVQEQLKQAFKLVFILNNQWIASALGQQPVDHEGIKVYQVGSINEAVTDQNSQLISYNAQNSTLPAPVLLSSASYDSAAESITVDVNSFGIFSLAGFSAPDNSLDDLSCYPNPFNPCKQDITIQYYLANDSDVDIAIYDLLGNLVKTWEIPNGDTNAKAGLNQLSWNGRNGQGDIVANGGYIAFVHSDGQKKKFKILVVK